MSPITRRTALRYLGSLAMVPTIRLRKTIDREAMLARFCLRDWDSPFAITSPFSIGTLTYATDARWACRTELSTPILDGERPLPDMGKVWKQFWRPADQFRDFHLPPIESLTLGGDIPDKCPECDNRRIFYGDDYPDSQEIMDSLPYYDVDTNTYRDASCPRCHGQPYGGPNRHQIGDVVLDYSRLKTIALISGVQVSPGRSRDDHQCLLFRGDGFEGILMGMTRKSTRRVK